MSKVSGKLVIFCAPSGSGKTTIVQHLIKNNSNLGFSISATTRPKREGIEENGKHYYFLTAEDFKQRIEREELAEWEEVYEGTIYGTLKSEIERLWEKGKTVLFDVDVKGGLNLKRAYGDKALSIFVKVPSIEVLEQRLRMRGTESEESLQKRLKKVKEEMEYAPFFDHVLVNDDLQTSFDKAQVLLDAFLEE